MTPATTMSVGPQIILSRTSIHPAPEQEKPLSFGLLVSQGAIAGLLCEFLFLLLITVVLPPIEIDVPWFSGIILMTSFVFGAAQGFIVWLASLLSGRRVGFLFRTIVGGFSTYLFVFVPLLLYGLTHDLEPSELLWPSIYGWSLAVIAALPFPYWRVLIRDVGAESILANAVGGGTGFLLRLIVTHGVVLSLILVIAALQWSYDQVETIRFAWVLGQFTISLIAVMLRLKFIPLLILSVLGNAPAIYWLYSRDFDQFSVPVVVYLALWGMYVLSHPSFIPSLFRFLYEEFRYYLID